MDVRAVTDSHGVQTFDSDLAAVLDSDQVEAINSDETAVLDSDVLAAIDPDMMVALDSVRGAADKSEGVTGTVSAGLVVTNLAVARQDAIAGFSDVAVDIGSDGPIQAVIDSDRIVGKTMVTMSSVGGRKRRYGVEGRKAKCDGWTNGH